MIDTTTSTLLAGSVIVIGRLVNGQGVSQRVVVGIIGSGLFLSLIGQADAELGQAFGMLVLLSAVFVYAVPVLRKTGLIDTPKPAKK